MWNSRICSAKECTAILVNSLTKLEYRGYDSAGIAVFEGDRIKPSRQRASSRKGLSKSSKTSLISQLRQV